MNNLIVKKWNRILSCNKDIYIYGARRNASYLFDIISYLGYSERIFGFVVTNKLNNPEKCRGFNVIEIEELVNNKDCLIILTQTGTAEKEIKEVLKNLKFKNFINVSELILRSEHDLNPLLNYNNVLYGEKSEEENKRNYEIREYIYNVLVKDQPYFGAIEPYQSFEKIGLIGLRPTLYRIAKYGLYDILSSNMTVLDIGCNMGFIDIEIAEKVNHVTGIEYEKSLADICMYVSKRLNIKNHTVENEEFSIWYSNNEGNKYDVIFSFAIHHWLNLSSNEYVCILDNLLNKNGYIWFESHNGLQIDEQYYEIVDIFKEKGYSILKDEAIADDGGVEPMLERRFVLIRKI